MRYGVLGDIHANLPALRAVLDALSDLEVDTYLCLGDVVGYGAEPEPCIDLIRGLDPVIVGGNHDWGVSGRLSLTYFNAAARAAIEWTQQALPVVQIEWLASLELTHAARDVTLAHGTLHDPHLFDYLVTPYDAYLSFRHLTTPLAFVGHSHVPVTFFEGNPITPTYEAEVDVSGRRAIVNVGSVGQPRDGNADASFGVYDDVTGHVSVHRVPYDVRTAAARIEEAGLPSILADRLYLGR